jgi:Leucine-rich repeat (LRR) protein
VIQALSRYTAADATLTAVIANGLSTLNTLVGSTAPVLVQALSAQAAQDAGNSTLATTFLSRLIASQSADGGWNADLYTTALATRAVATAANSAVQSTVFSLPDQALRRAINLALGRNAMDNLNRGELAQLTTLSAVGAGISDLTGLEWATHLTSANFNNNSLTSIAPLSGLTQLASLTWTGNPGNPGGPIQVPAVPEWGLALMALGLFSIMAYFRRTSVC